MIDFKCSLRDLRPGDEGRVVGFAADTAPLRLMEMGLLEGTRVRVVRYAPLGDPIDIKVRGYHLSLRREEAAGILIQPL